MSADTDPAQTLEHLANPPVDGSELIRFDQVTKRFGENTVLDRLDFSVDSGKHVTLIGPSGSGKTTILRLLMTITVLDMLGQARLFSQEHFQFTEPLTVIGVAFILISYPASLLIRALERRLVR